MKMIPETALIAVCSQVNGEYGLYVSVPESNERLVLNGGKKFNSASTIKIPLLALLLKDFEDERLNADQPIFLHEENRVGGSGILKSMSPALSMSLYDFAVLMTIISDNSATNQIIDAVGLERANAFFAENGWKNTHLAGKLFLPKPILPDGTEDFNSTSAEDLGDMMERVLRGTLVSENVSRQMMQIMAAQQLGRFNLSLPVIRFPNTRKPLPEVPEGRVIMANKGGTLTGKVLHDAAAMLLPNGKKAVLTMMTASPDKEATTEILKEVSRTLYDHLMKA